MELTACKITGAILEDMPADDKVSSMKFAGSTVMMVAESRQAVVDALKEDVYVKAGVWDLEKVRFFCLLLFLTLFLQQSWWIDIEADFESGDDLARQDCLSVPLKVGSLEEPRRPGSGGSIGIDDGGVFVIIPSQPRSLDGTSG